MERLVQFTFLGQNYKVYTGTSEEKMKQILSLIHEIEGEVMSEGGATLPVGKTAVMVSLNVASKYIQLQNEFKKYRAETEKRLGSLNDRIDTSVFQENSR